MSKENVRRVTESLKDLDMDWGGEHNQRYYEKQVRRFFKHFNKIKDGDPDDLFSISCTMHIEVKEAPDFGKTFRTSSPRASAQPSPELENETDQVEKELSPIGEPSHLTPPQSRPVSSHDSTEHGNPFISRSMEVDEVSEEDHLDNTVITTEEMDDFHALIATSAKEMDEFDDPPKSHRSHSSHRKRSMAEDRDLDFVPLTRIANLEVPPPTRSSRQRRSSNPEPEETPQVIEAAETADINFTTTPITQSEAPIESYHSRKRLNRKRRREAKAQAEAEAEEHAQLTVTSSVQVQDEIPQNGSSRKRKVNTQLETVGEEHQSLTFTPSVQHGKTEIPSTVQNQSSRKKHRSRKPREESWPEKSPDLPYEPLPYPPDSPIIEHHERKKSANLQVIVTPLSKKKQREYVRPTPHKLSDLIDEESDDERGAFRKGFADLNTSGHRAARGGDRKEFTVGSLPPDKDMLGTVSDVETPVPKRQKRRAFIWDSPISNMTQSSPEKPIASSRRRLSFIDLTGDKSPVIVDLTKDTESPSPMRFQSPLQAVPAPVLPRKTPIPVPVRRFVSKPVPRSDTPITIVGKALAQSTIQPPKILSKPAKLPPKLIPKTPILPPQKPQPVSAPQPTRLRSTSEIPVPQRRPSVPILPPKSQPRPKLVGASSVSTSSKNKGAQKSKKKRSAKKQSSRKRQ